MNDKRPARLMKPGACACFPSTLRPVRRWRQFCDCPCGMLWIRRDAPPGHPPFAWRAANVHEDGTFYGTAEVQLTPLDVVRGLYPECDVVMR